MLSEMDLGGLRSGMTVGLFGGSFDPPHVGHVHFANEALKRFALDRVIWLVSPGNPLKPNPPQPLPTRLAQCRAMLTNPALHVSGVEAVLGTPYTQQTLRVLTQRFAGVRFVWLMGADNLTGFHHWNGWRSIMNTAPIGVLARPLHRLAARRSVAARVFASAQIAEARSRMLARQAAPAWCFVNIPMRIESSTALRRQRLD